MRRALAIVWLGALAAAASCDPQLGAWGLGAIRDMKTPADDPTLACGPNPTEARAAERAACAFGPGAKPEETLGIAAGALARMPIRHVIVVMKENRSFDHMLGKLRERGAPDADGIPPGWSNPDGSGAPVPATRATTTCIPFDPGHQSVAMADGVDHGKMDGFVTSAARTTKSDGAFAMQYYDEADLPFTYWLARTFALADRDFAPMLTGTFANRSFMLFGTNAGVVDTGIVYPSPRTPSIFHLLMNAGFTWGAYTDGGPLSGTLDWSKTDPGVHTMQELYDALAAGALPNVAFVDGRESWEDDHPLADVQRGEAWLAGIYDRVVRAPQWPRTAMIFTYDEGGGFADHVPPPNGCAVTGSRWVERGPRVPLVAVSPWARRGFVSHVVRDHTSITRFIEAVFGLPALTARDANADALLDLFDFSCGRDLSVGAAPAPGAGGCPNPFPPGAD